MAGSRHRGWVLDWNRMWIEMPRHNIRDCSSPDQHSIGLSQLLRMCRPRRAPLGNWNSRFKAVEIVLVYSYAWLFASEHSPTRTRIRYIKYGYRTCDYVRTFQNETWAAYRAYAWAMVSTTTSTSGPIPAIQHMITSVVPCTASPSFTKIRPHNVFAVRR